MPGELPPILVASRKEQKHAGIGEKPGECMACAWTPYSKGYVPDTLGVSARVAFMFGFPTKDDTIEREALTGDMGAYILRSFVHPFGFKKEDLLISHVLRCQPPWSARYKRPAYPTGRTRDKAEITCRMYDEVLIKFNPNLFLITFSPRECIKVPAYRRQLQADLGKVRDFVVQGYRPLVLFGNEPAEMFAPYIKGRGSSKAWRGHFWVGDYKYSNFGNEGFASI